MMIRLLFLRLDMVACRCVDFVSLRGDGVEGGF